MDATQPVNPPTEPACVNDVVASNPTTEIPPPSLASVTATATKRKNIKNKWRPVTPELPDPHSPTASSSSACLSATSFAGSKQRGFRVLNGRRNPRALTGAAMHMAGDVDAVALHLGISIAAVFAQVLERKDAAMSVDHLSKICSLAVRESLANAFGDEFESFVRNFEKSFRSTLMSLRLVNESCMKNVVEHQKASNRGTCISKVNLHFKDELEDEVNENMLVESMNHQLTLHDTSYSSAITNTKHSTLEMGVVEHARSNDLKTFEIGLMMKKLQLKEKELAVNSEANILERWKLCLGVSTASFKAEKIKNELEDAKHTELLKSCIDCLVAGLFIMVGCLGYGTYVYSFKRINACTTESMPWWMPKSMRFVNYGLQTLSCKVQIVFRMVFGVLMIVVVAYLLIRRSATSHHAMPVTFILLLLGAVCGVAGKLCVDTLGGSGSHWLLYWEALCLLHFFSNFCISSLCIILVGPVTAPENTRIIFPYWMRRVVFYSTMLLLPLLCGLIPFAGPWEWKHHFLGLQKSKTLHS